MVPSQQMRLEQRLTPALIQSMEILELPLLALEARVREELEQNPVLEEVEPHTTQEPKPALEDPPATAENQAEADSFARLDQMSRDMEFDPGDLPYGRPSHVEGERDVKLDAMANTESRSESLRDILTRQWALIETTPQIRQAGEVIIDWMDDDGYLRTEHEHHPKHTESHGDNGHNGESAAWQDATPLILQRTPEESDHLMEEIAYSRQPPIDLQTLRDALNLIHTLEPAGVAARDLTECLLIQLRSQEPRDLLCEDLVVHHLADMDRTKRADSTSFTALAAATDRTVEEVRAAMQRIGKLNHHPGLVFRQEEVPKISPDIIVDYAERGEGYTARLARGSTPRLRISSQYREILSDRTADKATREYIKKRIEAASQIIDAIHYRRQRLLDLAKVILERQREFFDFGPQFMKVLRMRDVADEFHCDPSTISRTVDGKYLQSPRGIYPLRIFFAGGPKSDQSGGSNGGDEISWGTVKARVKDIIDAEDKSRPLTDDEITQKLSESMGSPIARRTVAKYRMQLGYPPHRERKAS